MKAIRLALIALLLAGCAEFPLAESPSRVEKHGFYSSILQMEKFYTIYLPPGYGESQESYPVVYFFRNHEDEWFDTSWPSRKGKALKEVMDALLEQGIVGKMILVGPNTGSNDGVMLGLGINYLHPELAASSVGTGRMEDYLIQEVTAHIDSSYRTIADRAHRGTEGHSSGGTPALALALRHPDLFASVGSFDGDCIWYNLDSPLVPGTGADDPFWLSSDYAWYNKMYAPIFGTPRDIPYMLTYGPANIIMAADAATLELFRKIRFHLETLPASDASNGAVNLQLLDIMQNKGLFNTFRDPFVAPDAIHDWPFADLHASHSLVHHWQTFTQPDWQIAATPSLHYDVTAFGESDTLEVEIYNTTAQPAWIASIACKNPTFQPVNLPAPPVRLDSANARLFVQVVFAPRDTGAVKAVLEIRSSADGTELTLVSLQGAGYHLTPPQPGFLYTASTTNYLLNSADITTGGATMIASLGITGKIGALAVRPSNGYLHGIASATDRTELYRVCARNGHAKRVATIPIGRILGMAFNASDSLYAGTADGKLYRVDPATGAATLIGTAPGIVFGGMAFHPQTGQLYASVRSTGTGKDNIYLVNTGNADTVLVGSTGDGKICTALAFDEAGKLYALKGSPGQENTLIAVDLATGKGTTVCSLGKNNLIALATTSIKTSVEANPKAMQPDGYALLQNYPNPFNSSTTIEFALARPGPVRVEICNILGETVAILVDRQSQAGRQKTTWTGLDRSGRAVPSGLYYILMNAGGRCSQRKMLLLR